MGISIGKISTNILTTIDFILETGEIEATWTYNSLTNKISSDARAKFNVDIENVENLVLVIDKWISWIRTLLHPDETGDIEYPNSSEIKTNLNGDIDFNITIGDLDIKEEWKKGDTFIELLPRNGFEVGWNEILYFIKEQKKFLNMIKEYKE